MKRFALLLATSLGAVACAVPAAATTPSNVSITTTGHFTSSTSAAGTWAATGAFTDSGSYTESFTLDAGTIHGVKTLVDAAGSTITLYVEARLVFVSPTLVEFADGNWQASGTGTYASLHAGGEPGAQGTADLAIGAIAVTHVGTAHFD